MNEAQNVASSVEFGSPEPAKSKTAIIKIEKPSDGERHELVDFSPIEFGEADSSSRLIKGSNRDKAYPGYQSRTRIADNRGIAELIAGVSGSNQNID